MSFIHAVESTRKDKTRLHQDSKGEIYVTVNDEDIVLRRIVFYNQAHGGILDDDAYPVRVKLPTTYLKHCPTIKIPIPVVRRTMNFDNKFFLAKVRKYQPGYGQQVARSFVRTGVLYAPFLYFYFEESSHEEQKGYVIKTFPKYSSKLDRNITFVDYGNFVEREDEKLKEEAIDVYIRMKELRRDADKLDEQLEEIDPEYKLRQEFEQMESKLVQNGGD